MKLGDGIERFTERDWQTTEDGTVRFALIGLGWWTVDVSIPAIEQSDLCETTVLVSSTKEKAQSHAETHGAEVGITYDEFHDGAAVDEYDAIYICTPNALHLQYVETAADLGKPVLCEKPLEATVERAEELVAAAEGEIPLMTAYRMQTEPVVRRAKELIEDGFIGQPVQAYSNNTQRVLDIIDDTDQWRLNSDLSGYGTSVMDLGIYSINTVRYLLDRDPVRVSAEMSSPDEAFGDVPDQYATYRLTLEDDFPVLCTTSQNAQDDTELKIIGTQGQIQIQPAFHGEAALHVKNGEIEATVEYAAGDAEFEMKEEFDYFADRILTDSEITPDGQHGLDDMRTLKAVYEAAERDETVEL